MRWIGATYDYPAVEPVLGRRRVLVLTRYGRLSPTTRVRFLQFIEHFERDGKSTFDFDVAPLLEDRCLQRFYDDGARSPTYLLKRYIMRVGLLLNCYRYDLVWIEKEIFPALPALAERLLSLLGVSTVVDYDDAAHIWYRRNPSWLVRTVVGHKIETVCRAASTVVAGNPSLAEFAKSTGARDVVVVPSVINIHKYLQEENNRPDKDRPDFVVGWIGTPSNVKYLQIFKDALIGMSTSVPDFKFMTIGAPGRVFDEIAQECHPWSEATETGLMARCDVTLAPLGDGELERGKCGFKVIQGMAVGVPVIASPVGVIKDIIQHGVNGFLAETASECHQVLNQLHAHPDLKLRIGQAARETVKHLYSDHSVVDRLRAILHGTMDNDYAIDDMAARLPGRSDTHTSQSL